MFKMPQLCKFMGISLNNSKSIILKTFDSKSIRIIGILLILLVCLSKPACGKPECVGWDDLATHLAAESTPLLELDLYDCPEEVEELEPSCTVAQIIENTFYLWKEYEIEMDDGSIGFCIEMKKPKSAPLSAEEAQVLLTASSLWKESQPGLKDTIILEPSDLNLRRRVINESPVYETKQFKPESVIGSDNRTRITNTTVFPWNTHCFLMSDFPAEPQSIGPNWGGTGCIVSPHMVLTCGHNVYDFDTKSWVQLVSIVPGQKQDFEGGEIVQPYGSRTSSDYRLNPDFMDTGDSEDDYGAVFFDEPISEINTYMPLEFSSSLSTGDTVYLAGYPAKVHEGTLSEETDSWALWEASGSISYVTSRYIDYTVDTSGGDSGGPVRKRNGLLDSDRIVAVHSSGATTVNTGPRLGSHNQALITEWMQWTPGDIKEYCSDDVPKDIPDLDTTTSSLEITATGTIADVDVKLDITHWWVEDLDVFLIAPDNTRVELFTDVGDWLWGGENFDDTILDDDASMSIVEGLAPFAGSYRPEGSLKNLIGKGINGTWNLEITDDSFLASGVLNSWCLIIKTEPPHPPIFEDSFPSTTIDPNKWILVDGATVDDTAGNEHSPPYSLHLESTDSVTSKEIDLSGYNSAKLNYYWKRVSTELGDDLNVEYWDGGNWKILDILTAGNNSNWEPNSLELPSDALHPQFKLRFRASCSSTFDEWYIDDVKIEYTSGDTVGNFRLLGSTGSEGDNPFSIVMLKTDPVEEVLVGPTSYISSLDFAPNGDFYGATSSLYIIDPVNGSYTTIGTIDSFTENSILMSSISFAPDGTLYGVSSVDQTLYTINPATAFATKIGLITGDYVWGIDFAPDSTLYGAFFNLVTINSATGEVNSIIGDISPVLATDLDFAPDGTIYTVDGSKVYQIDPHTASTTLVGNYVSGLWGIASQIFDESINKRLEEHGSVDNEVFNMLEATEDEKVLKAERRRMIQLRSQ